MKAKKLYLLGKYLHSLLTKQFKNMGTMSYLYILYAVYIVHVTVFPVRLTVCGKQFHSTI